MQQTATKPERRIPALAVSRGVGIGRVVFLQGEKRHFFRIDLEESQIDAEILRFRSAVTECTLQLNEIASHDPHDSNQPVASIFGVHLLIIEESSLVEKIESVIRDRGVNAEWSLKVVTDKYLAKQNSVADLHFREKYLDIEDVAERLMTALIGSPSMVQLTYSGAVVVARELRPSAILEINNSNPAALITERGGWTSHTSILAREFMLPMASGIRNLERTFSHGDCVIVDGVNGQVIIDPDTDTLAHYDKITAAYTVSNDLPDVISEKATTLDGVEIAIRANVDIPEAYQLARHFGAEGIGLFRSESLITRPGKIPSEDEQILAYNQMAEIVGKAGVKIRTFDIGFDQLTGDGLSSELNPSLGLRSIRFSLQDSTYFRTQIRAIFRAAFKQSIDIVLPMISGVSEILQSRTIIDEERASLAREGIEIGSPKLGAMIEVPSGVFTAREIARRVDFLCLGTNDLVQYLLAVDRDNDSVADWYQTLHPAVIRAISEVISAAKSAGIPLLICGEMAGSAFYVPLLIGLGARELSMNVNSIHQIRRLISGISLSHLNELIERVKTCETADETETVLREHYLANWADLFPPGLLNSKHR